MVIGAGTMGFEMIKALTGAGHEVLVSDIDAEKVKRALTVGAIQVRSPRIGAAFTDVSLLSLSTPEIVQTVVCGEEGILSGVKEGHVIVDTSTVDPFSTRENAARAKEKLTGYLDAPVLGRPQSCGKWTLPVGGDQEYLKQIEHILKTFSNKVVYVGSSGNGNIVKLLNNMMLGVTNMISVEILAIAEKMGMDPSIVYDTIAGSGAASVSNMFIELGPKVLKRDFSPVFTINLMHKDMDLGIQMTKKVGAASFMTSSAQKLNEIALEKGFGAEDTGAIIKIYENLVEKS